MHTMLDVHEESRRVPLLRSCVAVPSRPVAVCASLVHRLRISSSQECDINSDVDEIQTKYNAKRVMMMKSGKQTEIKFVGGAIERTEATGMPDVKC